MAPGDLEKILEGLPRQFADENVLVGLDHADDAAVYRLDDERALVFTVDVITPIVDDPRTFGRIAAANSISDIYAMGARPLMALNVSCFSTKVPPEVLREILAGASDVGLEAGCPILGGHTVKDSEIKFGLAVIGLVHPDHLLTNGGANEGDVLLLNKGIGTSALSTALKSGRFDESSPWFAPLIANMTSLNGKASEVAQRFGATALTDITGFGISGHMAELAAASGLTVRLNYDAIPALDGAVQMLAEGFTCGGSHANRSHSTERLAVTRNLLPEQAELLHDPQTSGPLVLCVPPDRADAALAGLREAGYPLSARVGQLVRGVGTLVEVV